MEDLLNKLYYDPKSGYIGSDKLYRKAKAIDRRITKKQVSAWYQSQHSIQRFSAQRKRLPQFKIASDNPNEWQLDLAFWEKQPILISVNINSRIGFAKLLKNKKADVVLKAIKEFVDNNVVSAVFSDNGSEFINKSVESFFDEQSITHSNAFAGDHTVLGKIDRFIRTIKAKLTKMKEVIRFKKLTQSILVEAIDNYNDTYHSAINAKPSEMEGKVMMDDVEYNKHLVKRIQKVIKAGAVVRFRIKSKSPFEKEAAKWSRTTYEVIGFDGLKIRIKSKNNNILFKPVNDLKVVNSNPTNANFKKNQIYEVEKILDHKKTKSGKNKYLIKWLGHEDTSWEPQDHLRLINKNQISDLEKEYLATIDPLAT